MAINTICGGIAVLAIAGASSASTGLIISEVVDATLPGGLPKFVELTNTSNAAIDLSGISIGNFSNGGTVLGGGDSTLLSGMLAAGDSYVVSYENGDEAGIGSFFDAFGFDPDFFGLGAFINGDDVVAIFDGLATGDGSDATMIDVYGVVGVDGSGEVWEYTDGFSFRNPDVLKGNGGAFADGEWTFGGANSLEDPGFDDVIELQNLLDNATPRHPQLHPGSGLPRPAEPRRPRRRPSPSLIRRPTTELRITPDPALRRVRCRFEQGHLCGACAARCRSVLSRRRTRPPQLGQSGTHVRPR